MRPFEICRPNFFRLVLGSMALLSIGCQVGKQPTSPDPKTTESPSVRLPEKVRVALFNIRELKTTKITQMDDAGTGIEPQARAAASIIQKIRPDILIINEIDHDYDRLDEGYDLNARLFSKHYLKSGTNPIEYPYAYAAPNNTGLLTLSWS